MSDTRTPGQPPFDLYPEQRQCMFNDSRTALVEASTKSGKTTVAMLWLYDQLQQAPPGGAVWWVGPVYSQARIPFIRYRAWLRGYPVNFVNSAGGLQMRFPGDRTMYFKSATKPDSLYGEDVWAAIIDEASRCKGDSIVAVRSTLSATRGPWRLIGNVSGMSNMFYQWCREAEKGSMEAHYQKINAYTAARYGLPGLPDLEEIEQAQKILPGPQFRELYLAEPAGVDINPFGIEDIAACVQQKEPEDREVVAWGIDVGKTVDYTVIIGLNKGGDEVYFDRFQDNWDSATERIAETVGTHTPGFVDATGVGSAVADALIYKFDTAIEPYVFTQQSKLRLMERLKYDMSEGSISYSEDVAEELMTMEYERRPFSIRFEAGKGFHDDAVMAYALALQHLRGWEGSSW